MNVMHAYICVVQLGRFNVILSSHALKAFMTVICDISLILYGFLSPQLELIGQTEIMPQQPACYLSD